MVHQANIAPQLNLHSQHLPPPLRFNHITQRMASACPDRIPPLLRIPGEIRNRIYEFALASPDGLYYNRTIEFESWKPVLYTLKNEEKPVLYTLQNEDWSDPETSKHRIDNVWEYNQLKYVNRQLYTETAGIE